MNLFNKLEESYENLWKMIIRPTRCTYSVSELGPQDFMLEGTQVKRIDFELTNTRGFLFYCSHWIPVGKEQYPCVVFLHRNSSNRTQGLDFLAELIKQGISLVTFDFSGCGNSQGEYITLGWYEWEDLAQVIRYLRNKTQVSKIAIWGRSMGAVTALMYLKRDPEICAAVFDSPFKSLHSLIEDLCRKNSKIPMFILNGAVKIISKTIEDRAKFDIYKLNPLKTEVPHIMTPGLFVVSKDDEMVDPKHSEELYKAYTATKDILVTPGLHNTRRSHKTVKEIMNFLKKYLDNGKEKEPLVIPPQHEKERIDFFAELDSRKPQEEEAAEKVDFFAQTQGKPSNTETSKDNTSKLASIGNLLSKLSFFTTHEPRQKEQPKEDAYFSEFKNQIDKTFLPQKSRQSHKINEQKQQKIAKIKSQPTDNTFESQCLENVSQWCFL